MKQSHTPGPWTVSEQFGSVGAIKALSGFVAFPAGNVREIDETRGNDESWLDMRERTEPARKALAAEVQANARLIAAAPNLLAAAQKALAECCDLAETDAGRALEAAVAEATGGHQ